MIEWQGQQIPTDKDGFLRNQYQWSEELAHSMALAEGIELSAEHWVLIHYLREYYEDYNIAPPMRIMVKIMANEFGADTINSRFLHSLFPDGPARQGSRLAGLPKPKNCVR